MTKTVKVEIKSRWDLSCVLFSADVLADIEEKYRLRAALTMAVEARANLAGANLARANLAGANLARANLAGANLAGAKITASLTLAGERPLFFLGPIGSCARVFHAYITNDGLRLRAGCFFGTRDEFMAKLADEHGENNHGIEYRAALALIDSHVAMWSPPTEEKAGAQHERTEI